MQEVMSELRQLGVLDPAAQDQLFENLRESDPSIWPLVVQQVRATAAYRRRAAERLPVASGVAVAPAEAPPGRYPIASVAPVDVQPPPNQASNEVLQASYAEESAPLVVRNVAFCTEIKSYGCAKRFEKYEFQPNQEVLLYAEVDNFVSEPTAKGYHTSLRSGYRILDASGQPVVERSFAATEDYCQNLRRDFFIGYRLRLPQSVGPGKYTLQLSIEDLKSQKVGQGSVEFEVRMKGEDGSAKGEKEPEI
jgi:hypothetical protein